MKVLIVGGVAGGASAGARLRRLNEEAEIIIFEKNEFISFANCGLPYYIGGDIKQQSDLVLQTPQQFKKKFNIDVRNFNEVISIDKENKRVEVYDHKNKSTYTESYDKLILSPGAKSIIPQFRGSTSQRIFTLRNIPDTIKIKEYINKQSPKSVAIIGGGYIGIEMAENLKKLGINTTIVQKTDHIIGSLDYDMACEVHNYLRQKEVNLILEDSVVGIEEQKEKLLIKLNNHDIEADMVIMSIGVEPDTKIVRDANIEVNLRGAIKVNEYMQTSDENIYAVGDAVEINEFVTNEKKTIALAGPANKQASVAPPVYANKFKTLVSFPCMFLVVILSII